MIVPGRMNRSLETSVRPSTSFADGVLGTDPDACMSGRACVPSVASPALSGDVLRAYENYQREITEAAMGFMVAVGILKTNPCPTKQCFTIFMTWPWNAYGLWLADLAAHVH